MDAALLGGFLVLRRCDGRGMGYLSINPNPVKTSTCDRGFSVENTLSDQYLRLDQTAAEDPDGEKGTYVIPYSVGSLQGISTMARNRERRILIRHIQHTDRIVNDIWRQELNLPDLLSTSPPHSLAQQIAIFGGWGDGVC